MTNLKSRIIASFLTGGLACLLACGQKEPLPKTDRSFSGEPLQMIEFGTGTPDPLSPGHQNMIKVTVLPIGQDHTTTRSIGLDQAYELRFLPLVQGEPHAQTLIETWVIDGDKTETVLHSAAPIFLEDPQLKNERRVETLRQTARVDLSRFKGKNIRLRWRAKDLSPGASVMIGLPQLVPFAPDQRRPDILLALSDTHRWDHAFGAPGAQRMPQLNAMRAHSTVFNRAYATASWTLPSIVSVFTGEFPRWHRTGERTASGPSKDKPADKDLPPGEFAIDWTGTYYQLRSYPRELTSLGERLAQAGYFCVWVVANVFYESSGLGDDLGGVVFYSGPTIGARVNADAIQMLQAVPADQPIAMLVHTMDVHEWQTGNRYPPDESLPTPHAIARDRYGDSVTDADNLLHDLLQAWSTVRKFDETMFVFFADHGEHVEDPDPWGALFSGHGTTMQEALLHVPLLVHFPDSLNLNLDGKVIDEPVSLIDLYPTLLEIAGAPVDLKEVQGRSLIALATGKQTDERSLFADYQLYGVERSSVRRNDFKLMLDFDTPEETLIQVRHSSETLREIPEMVSNDETMRAMLKDEFERYRGAAAKEAAGLKSDTKINPEAMKRLKGLGYIQ